MLNDKDSKNIDRIAKYAYPILLITMPLSNIYVYEWFAPRVQHLAELLQTNYPFVYPSLIGLLLLGIGWTAFKVKTHWRGFYGAAELAVAYFSGIAWFTSSNEMGLKELLAGAAVVYLVVRGLDNMNEAKKAKKAARTAALASN